MSPSPPQFPLILREWCTPRLIRLRELNQIMSIIFLKRKESLVFKLLSKFNLCFIFLLQWKGLPFILLCLLKKKNKKNALENARLVFILKEYKLPVKARQVSHNLGFQWHSAKYQPQPLIGRQFYGNCYTGVAAIKQD